MTIRDAVIACVRMGMDWRTVALAYKLSELGIEVDDIIRIDAAIFRSRPPRRSKSRGAR